MPSEAHHPLDQYPVVPAEYDAKDNPYRATKLLGRGSYGTVQVVENKAGEKFARKKFEHPSSMIEDAAELQQKEDQKLKQIHSSLTHDQRTHIIRRIESYTTDARTESAQHYLVMSPVADGGNLAQFLDESLKSRPRPDFFWCRMMGCLVTGLAMLHQAQIRHHDIHPGNILVHQGAPLYCDFGLAYYFQDALNSDTQSDQPKQHRQFAAPEYLTNHTERGRKADVFGLGGVLYEIAAVLLNDESMLELRPTRSPTYFGDKTGSMEARIALWEAYDAARVPMIKFWLHAIIKMLDFDPQKRPSAGDIMRELLEFGSPPMCLECYAVARDLYPKIEESYPGFLGEMVILGKHIIICSVVDDQSV